MSFLHIFIFVEYENKMYSKRKKKNQTQPTYPTENLICQWNYEGE